MDALLGNPWQEHDTTLGIDIKQIKVTDTTGKRITLNGWDFGGQRVIVLHTSYSSVRLHCLSGGLEAHPGFVQGSVPEWIKPSNAAPGAKILVVATHGASAAPARYRPPELWDSLADAVVDFCHVE
jgi:hypothetical protein